MPLNARRTARPTPALLGLPLSEVDLPGAVATIRHAAAGADWHYVVTPNAAHLARLGQDPTLLDLYRGASLALLDSRVVAIALRLAGSRPPPVVTGADLVARLFHAVIEPETSVCIVGGTEAGVARLRDIFGLNRVQHHAPRMGFWQNPAEFEAAAQFAAAARADYTFLVVGSPQQERLAARIARLPGARGIGICAGAAIEFLTGEQQRAPRLVQRLALEWCWRLLSDPRRLAYRYCIESPRALWLVMRSLRQPARDVSGQLP